MRTAFNDSNLLSDLVDLVVSVDCDGDECDGDDGDGDAHGNDDNGDGIDDNLIDTRLTISNLNDPVVYTIVLEEEVEEPAVATRRKTTSCRLSPNVFGGTKKQRPGAPRDAK